MLKKWLLPGAVILALASLALSASWWSPRLLEVAGSHSAQIGGLQAFVQLVLWTGALLVFLTQRLSSKPKKAEPVTPKPTVEAPDLTAPTRIYLKYLVDAYQYLDLRGMGVADRVPLKLPLLEMYVPLKARLSMPEGEAWARNLRVAGRPAIQEETETTGERVSEPMPVLDLLRKHDGLVLLGIRDRARRRFSSC